MGGRQAPGGGCMQPAPRRPLLTSHFGPPERLRQDEALRSPLAHNTQSSELGAATQHIPSSAAPAMPACLFVGVPAQRGSAESPLYVLLRGERCV